MPLFIVPVSMRTMKCTLSPVIVVVCATSDGRCNGSGSGANAPPFGPGPGLQYTYCTTVVAEQFLSIGEPSVDPSGSLNASVWQTNGCCHGPESTGAGIG